MATTQIRWSWTSFRREDALSIDGIQCYRGVFTTFACDPSQREYERQIITFAAHRPTSAMREIAASGSHPSEYAGKIVN